MLRLLCVLTLIAFATMVSALKPVYVGRFCHKFEVGSCDWLRRLWWLYELALGSRKVLDSHVLEDKKKDKRKEKVK